MTETQARRLVLEWAKKHPRAELSFKENGRDILSQDGAYVKDRFLEYDWDLVNRAVRHVEHHEQFKTTDRIFAYLKANSENSSEVAVPAEWESFGHRRVLQMKDFTYGVYEDDGGPVIWVLQAKKSRVQEHKREWTLLGPNAYQFGYASPVSEAKASEVREEWRSADEEGTNECVGPWWLYMKKDELPVGDELF
jgi:hypothetical protein